METNFYKKTDKQNIITTSFFLYSHVNICLRIFSLSWNAIVVDGHDVAELCRAFHDASVAKGKPTCIVAKTFKGRGINGVFTYAFNFSLPKVKIDMYRKDLTFNPLLQTLKTKKTGMARLWETRRRKRSQTSSLASRTVVRMAWDHNPLLTMHPQSASLPSCLNRQTIP